jgi:hypothetical protein
MTILCKIFSQAICRSIGSCFFSVRQHFHELGSNSLAQAAGVVLEDNFQGERAIWRKYMVTAPWPKPEPLLPTVISSSRAIFDLYS